MKTEKKWITDSEEIEVITLDSFCNSQNINKLDLVKIDVEGHTYEVLLGAENMLQNISVVQAECELKFSDWEGQKYDFIAVNELLKQNNFELAYFERLTGGHQCDCIWIKSI